MVYAGSVLGRGWVPGCTLPWRKPCNAGRNHRLATTPTAPAPADCSGQEGSSE